LVKLQRPPPEMRIFLPMRPARSSTATRRPRFPASMAHISPAAPPPRMMTSNSCFTIFVVTISDVHVAPVIALGQVNESPREARNQWRRSLPSADGRTPNAPREGRHAQFDAQRLLRGCTCGRRPLDSRALQAALESGSVIQ